MLSVCFVARRDLFTKRGGDTILCELYASFILNKGGDVSYWVEDDGFPEADVYHAFNIDRPLEIYPRLKYISDIGKKYVITTLHHPCSWVERFRVEGEGVSTLSKFFYSTLTRNSSAYSETLKEFIRQALNRQPEWTTLQKSWLTRIQWILNHADCLLLQSNLELKYINHDYKVNISLDKSTALPNPSLPIAENAKKVEKIYDALFVGRIEVRKNPLALIYAAKKLNISLLLIGRPNPNETAYVEKVARLVEGSNHLTWIKGVSREELQDFYKKSKVLVNPSYVEVSPIVDIEGLANGCPLITTKYALHHEFLPKETKLCDPYAIDSIVECLQGENEFFDAANVMNEKEVSERLLVIYRESVL